MKELFPYLSVVIPTYNRVEILQKTLSALEKQDYPLDRLEIIVVNDGSIDATQDFLKVFHMQYKGNFSFFEQKNGGQGKARNYAFRYISDMSDITLILGDDIMPTDTKFLYNHVLSHRDNSDEFSVVLGYTQWHPRLQINDFMKFLDWSGQQFGQKKSILFRLFRWEIKQDYYDFWHFYTSNISLKSSLVKHFFFDERFSGYGWEDIEYAYRLHKFFKNEGGLKLYFNKTLLAYHDHPMESQDYFKKMPQLIKNGKLFESLHSDISIFPQGFKKFVFKMISHPYSPFSLGWFGKNFLYYAKLKRYYILP
jgi:glycosyltransferase involved in cell wall biosynthesis